MHLHCNRLHYCLFIFPLICFIGSKLVWGRAWNKTTHFRNMFFISGKQMFILPAFCEKSWINMFVSEVNKTTMQRQNRGDGGDVTRLSVDVLVTDEDVRTGTGGGEIWTCDLQSNRDYIHSKRGGDSSCFINAVYSESYGGARRRRRRRKGESRQEVKEGAMTKTEKSWIWSLCSLRFKYSWQGLLVCHNNIISFSSQKIKNK